MAIAEHVMNKISVEGAIWQRNNEVGRGQKVQILPIFRRLS
jgi:hypothetical protein